MILTDTRSPPAKPTGRRLNVSLARPLRTVTQILWSLSSQAKTRRGRRARLLRKLSKRLMGVPLRVARSLRRASMVKTHGRLRCEVGVRFSIFIACVGKRYCILKSYIHTLSRFTKFKLIHFDMYMFVELNDWFLVLHSSFDFPYVLAAAYSLSTHPTPSLKFLRRKRAARENM
jgi:hypothetical protein